MSANSVTECSGRAQLPCDSRCARNGCHGMLMEPCSGRQPRCLKKLTKIALAHFAWPFMVATTMIPQQSITKNHCLGSTRRFHTYAMYIYIYINYIALAIDPFLVPCYCLSIVDRLPIACPIDSRSIWAGPGPAPVHVRGPRCHPSEGPGGRPPRGPSERA